MRERTRVLVEIALTIALCVVLNYVKVWQMPQGGSVSLDMLPLIVLSLRRGPLVGIAAGAVFGALDAALDPVVVHPVQFILDYPLAFGVVGVAGLFAGAWRKSFAEGRRLKGIIEAIVPATALAAVLRYAAHVVSGVIYFSEFAEGQPVLAYSLGYNSFVMVSALACGIAAASIMPALSRLAPPRQAAR